MPQDWTIPGYKYWTESLRKADNPIAAALMDFMTAEGDPAATLSNLLPGPHLPAGAIGAAGAIKWSKELPKFSKEARRLATPFMRELNPLWKEVLDRLEVQPPEALSASYANELKRAFGIERMAPMDVLGLFSPPRGTEKPWGIQVRTPGKFLDPLPRFASEYTPQEQAFTLRHEVGHMGEAIKKAIRALEAKGKPLPKDIKEAADAIRFASAERSVAPRDYSENVANLFADVTGRATPLTRREGIEAALRDPNALAETAQLIRLASKHGDIQEALRQFTGVGKHSPVRAPADISTHTRRNLEQAKEIREALERQKGKKDLLTKIQEDLDRAIAKGDKYYEKIFRDQLERAKAGKSKLMEGPQWKPGTDWP